MDLGKFRTLARNWEAFGDADPFFGVLSDPTKASGKWTVDEFFESGRAHVQHLIRSLRDAGASFDRGLCLDFGCGVGRLTLPLSRYFSHTIGLDVARSMIRQARRFKRPDDRCEFVVNRGPDLHQFADATFDVVHSCLVLQHIPPEISLHYIREFFRVCKPLGLVVFQVPAETISEAAISAAHALPEGGHKACLTIVDPPDTMARHGRETIRVAITNESGVEWCHDIPAGRHLCVGNHWLKDGTVAVQDDGRVRLPRTIRPGESTEVGLPVQAPSSPGLYELQIDLVQEHVCWFAEKGSRPARSTVHVVSATYPPEFTQMDPDVALESAPRRSGHRSWFGRLLSRLRGGVASFEMHTIPLQDVEQTIRAGGGTLLKAIDDNAAGERWLSYTYICRRS